MNPEPTANPHAELVMECFGNPPATESPAPDRSPITPPELMLARGSGWCGVEEPAVEKGDDFFQEGKVVDSWICLQRLIGQGGYPVGLGRQIAVVEDRSNCGLVGGCTLPSLKELGLDVYLRKQN